MQTTGKLLNFSLTSLRFVLAAWIGAAVLYVLTSVAEQTSPAFDSLIRDQLATIRFPLYYRFGFGIHIIGGLLAAVVWRAAPSDSRRRFLIVFLLVCLSALLVSLDYRLIYQPLEDLVTPPGQVRSQDFIRLHTWSRYANEVHLSVMAVAAVLSAMPLKPATAANGPQ